MSALPAIHLARDSLPVSRYLYIGIKVLDSQLYNDTTGASVTWQDDPVEVYIDANHRVPPQPPSIPFPCAVSL